MIPAEQADAAAACPPPGLDLTPEPQLLVLGAPALSRHLVFSEHPVPADAADCCQPLLQQAPLQLAGAMPAVQRVCLADAAPSAGQSPVAADQTLVAAAAAQTPVAADQTLAAAAQTLAAAGQAPAAAAQTPVAPDQPPVVPEQSETAGLADGAADMAAAFDASSADAASCPAADEHAVVAAVDAGQEKTAVLALTAVAAGDLQWGLSRASGHFAVVVQDPGAAAATAVVCVDCPAERVFASAAAADSSPAAVAVLPDAQAAVLSACDAVAARMQIAAAELLVVAVLAASCHAGFADLAGEAARHRDSATSLPPVPFAQSSAGVAGQQR